MISIRIRVYTVLRFKPGMRFWNCVAPLPKRRRRSVSRGARLRMTGAFVDCVERVNHILGKALSRGSPQDMLFLNLAGDLPESHQYAEYAGYDLYDVVLG